MSNENIIVASEDGVFKVAELSSEALESITPRTTSNDGSHTKIDWRFQRSSDPNTPNSVVVRNNSGQSIRVKFPISYGWLCGARVSVETFGGEQRSSLLPPKVIGICLPAISEYM